jgi:hypothetical protein
MAKTEDDLITQSEAARLRGVTRSAIAYLITQGRLHTHERYGVRFVSRREVLDYAPHKPGPKAAEKSARRSSRKKAEAKQ